MANSLFYSFLVGSIGSDGEASRCMTKGEQLGNKVTRLASAMESLRLQAEDQKARPPAAPDSDSDDDDDGGGAPPRRGRGGGGRRRRASFASVDAAVEVDDLFDRAVMGDSRDSRLLQMLIRGLDNYLPERALDETTTPLEQVQMVFTAVAKVLDPNERHGVPAKIGLSPAARQRQAEDELAFARAVGFSIASAIAWAMWHRLKPTRSRQVAKALGLASVVLSIKVMERLRGPVSFTGIENGLDHITKTVHGVASGVVS